MNRPKNLSIVSDTFQELFPGRTVPVATMHREAGQATDWVIRSLALGVPERPALQGEGEVLEEDRSDLTAPQMMGRAIPMGRPVPL